jgi:hypothetical protein
VTAKDQTKPYDNEIDLEVLTDSPIVRVVGYIANEFGDPSFKVTRIITQDGQSFYVEGEHDFPYLTGLDDRKVAEHYKPD